MAVRAWIGSATVVAVVSAASIVVAGSPAHAGPGPMPTVEVRVIGGLKQLTYIDKAGGASRVRIRSTWVDVIVDEAYPISIISGCTHPTPSDATLVLCPGPFHAVIVATGDGDDFIDDLPSAPAILWSGLTQVTAGPGNDRVIGSGFVDVLTGGEGDDVLDGWSGNDVLVGGTGADEMHGGAGVDRVEYFDHDVGVTISNDGVVFNDGQPGEQDTIYGDVENLVGGPRDDILIGNDGANKLQGGAGNDALYGNGGDDVLVGGADGETITAVAVAPYEADLLDGGYGNDTVSYDVWGGTLGVTVYLDDETGDDGAPGEGDTIRRVEHLIGTAFDDTLIGTAGPNVINGLGGNDLLVGQDGPDALNGGSGDDVLVAGAGLDTMNGGPGTDHCIPGLDGGTSAACEDD